ncbi:MAG: DNA repair protein RadC [Gammaproteobacteria bacterium]
MIRNWPVKSRPRERLINEGAEVLTDAELLAIILRTGTSGKSVVSLAQELLNQFGDLRSLLTCEQDQFQQVKGLGPAKFAQIAAIKVIAQRSLREQLSSKPTLCGSKDAANFLLSKMRDYKLEVFACLLLDTRNQLIRYEELFTGSINGACIYPREVVKLVLKTNAAAVIFAHNHPSGNTQPSEADKLITNQLKKALALIDVRVLDHIIVGDDSFSMAECGLI